MHIHSDNYIGGFIIIVLILPLIVLCSGLAYRRLQAKRPNSKLSLAAFIIFILTGGYFVMTIASVIVAIFTKN